MKIQDPIILATKNTFKQVVFSDIDNFTTFMDSDSFSGLNPFDQSCFITALREVLENTYNNRRDDYIQKLETTLLGYPYIVGMLAENFYIELSGNVEDSNEDSST